MTFDEYFDQLCGMLMLDGDFTPVEIEIEKLPDESEEDAYIRYMVEQGFMEEHGDSYLFDVEKIREFSPDLAKIIEVTVDAEIYSTMDSLVDKGIVSQSVDEDGETVWLLEEDKLEIVREYLQE